MTIDLSRYSKDTLIHWIEHTAEIASLYGVPQLAPDEDYLDRIEDLKKSCRTIDRLLADLDETPDE